MAVVAERDGKLVLEGNDAEHQPRCSKADLYVSPLPQGGFLGVGFLPDNLMVAETPFRRVVLPEGGAERPERWAGVYQWSQGPITIRVAEGRLCLHSATFGEEVACPALSDTRFACKRGTFDVEPGGIRWGGFRSIPRVPQSDGGSGPA